MLKRFIHHKYLLLAICSCRFCSKAFQPDELVFKLWFKAVYLAGDGSTQSHLNLH